LWLSLGAIAGQKIIATHSGDLLARVPLTAIRRFCRKNGKVQVCSVQPGVLTPEEEKRVDFHLQNCRGELLFARCWLLSEGESEYWVFREAADILGYDLDRLGIRIVNTRYSGVEILVKVANELGIGWCFVGDGDDQGQNDGATCQNYLQGRNAAEVICVLPRRNIEVVLCESGFGQIYEAHVSPQKRDKITATKCSPKYWDQVVSAQPKKEKPVRIREVMAEMRAAGPESVPLTLKAAIEAAIKTAENQA
jgi:putative ATP-dependent endonuclease of OLD family